jgi:hypothetical protein
MTSTTTLEDLAVRGRRVLFTYFRQLGDGPEHPGIITGLEDGDSGSLRALIRIDGTRSNLSVPVDYEGLTYLEEVVDVPDLPMGPFTPAANDLLGVWEDVPLATIGEDGTDLIILTDDRDKAVAAARAYDREVGVDVHFVNYDAIKAYWAVFTWEPEDSEFPWTVRWDAQEGDNQAIRIHYLPA